MSFGRYTKLVYAILAGLVVAVPAWAAAQNDGVSLGEALTILGLFLPAVAAGLSPANKLATGDLVEQINKNPDIELNQVTATAPTHLP
jgi:hypothetical protein